MSELIKFETQAFSPKEYRKCIVYMLKDMKRILYGILNKSIK